MARSRLDDTYDFLELFEYVAGEWTTPKQFFRWTAISLIAACLEDRVFYPWQDHAPTYPNLWTFLIGSSGTGKDHATGMAMHLLKPEDPIWKIDGKVTMPALYDYMFQKQKAAQRESAPVYLISSDVTEQLPVGPEAKDFTSRALSLYGGRERAVMDITRTHGEKIIKRPLLNWLGGCTPEWFPAAIDPQTFVSGFAGRAMFVIGEPNYENYRLASPIRRFDHELVMDHLRERVERFQQLEGVFVMSDNAKIAHQMWLDQQQFKLLRTTLSDIDKNVVNRMKTSVMKLAMIFAVAKWKGGLLIIKRQHIYDAIDALDSVLNGVRLVSDYAHVSEDTMVANRIEELIRTAGVIRKAALIRIGRKRGLKSTRQLEEILDMLKASGQIEIRREKPDGRGQWPVVVVWKSRKLLFKEVPIVKAEEPAPAEADPDDAYEAFFRPVAEDPGPGGGDQEGA